MHGTNLVSAQYRTAVVVVLLKQLLHVPVVLLLVLALVLVLYWHGTVLDLVRRMVVVDPTVLTISYSIVCIEVLRAARIIRKSLQSLNTLHQTPPDSTWGMR